jgi:alpha-L-fucosidase
MRITYATFAVALLVCIPMTIKGQTMTIVQEDYQQKDNAPRPVFPLPSERQMAWHETEFYAFFHYGMNTFTGKEWGEGSEPESTYAPAQLPNCAQWIAAVKAAHMKGGIAVVKHHDGFCLWPTATTTHCVTSCSGEVAKKVNIPKLFSDACKSADMKYGFYVSPWDRNSAYYGTDKYVSDVFTKQVMELCDYGNDQFEIWFDGANGGTGYYGGKGGSVSISRATYYDKPNLLDAIHKVQPNCVIWGGGEGHWVGNEAGYGADESWNLVLKDGTRNSDDADVYGHDNGVQWDAPESDAKLTSGGWFWHSGETTLSAERLFQMYLETVGRGTNLILNCPPNTSGVLPDADVTVLKNMGDLLDQRLGTDLARSAVATASDERGDKYKASMVNDGDKTTYWATNDNVTTGATLTLSWDSPITAHYVCLQEFIRLGQRVRSFTIETSTDGQTWTKRASNICKTIGYKRIVPLGASTSSYATNAVANVKAIRITVTGTKACPTLQTVSVY